MVLSLALSSNVSNNFSSTITSNSNSNINNYDHSDNDKNGTSTQTHWYSSVTVKRPFIIMMIKVIMITTILMIIVIKALWCDISSNAKKTMITMTIPTPLTITMPQIVAFTKTKTTMLITTSFTWSYFEHPWTSRVGACQAGLKPHKSAPMVIYGDLHV